MNIDVHAHAHASSYWVVVIFGACIVIYYIIAILFAKTLYKLGKNIDQDKQIFPAWFSWMFLVPFVSYIFHWLVMPFGIGSALKKYHVPNIANNGSKLFGIGLVFVILPLFFWIPVINIFLMIALFILFIAYWNIASKTNKMLLEHKKNKI